MREGVVYVGHSKALCKAQADASRYATLENPLASRAWALFKKIFEDPAWVQVRLDQCRTGVVRAQRRPAPQADGRQNALARRG
eukprot:11576318-Heterocapsa_arctica.AAC.1